MTYESFLRDNGNAILGHAMLAKMVGGASIPPVEIAESQFEELKDLLVRCMPSDSIFMDLWDWDIHFEDDLGNDWFFSVVLDSVDPQTCAEPLVDFFHQKREEFAMDYDHDSDLDAFEEFIATEAITFVSRWRANVFERREKLLQSVATRSGCLAGDEGGSV